MIREFEWRGGIYCINWQGLMKTGTLDGGKTVESMDRGDELEGFSFLSSLQKGVAVTSSRRDNVNFIDINW